MDACKGKPINLSSAIFIFYNLDNFHLYCLIEFIWERTRLSQVWPTTKCVCGHCRYQSSWRLLSMAVILARLVYGRFTQRDGQASTHRSDNILGRGVRSAVTRKYFGSENSPLCHWIQDCVRLRSCLYVACWGWRKQGPCRESVSCGSTSSQSFSWLNYPRLFSHDNYALILCLFYERIFLFNNFHLTIYFFNKSGNAACKPKSYWNSPQIYIWIFV
jgi:hypothetical protein